MVSMQSVSTARNILGEMRSKHQFQKTVRRSDVFIVAFPRSGTNWVRFFIALILAENAQQPDDVLTLRNYRDYVPDINEEYFGSSTLAGFETMPNPRVFSVHARRDDRLPRVIYLVRDPRDALTSYFYYHLRTEQDFRMQLGDFVTRRNLWPCQWDEHVDGWLALPSHHNILVLRYENMRSHPEDEFRRILQFCDVPFTEPQFARALEQSAFQNMQALERRYGTRETQGDQSVPFVRRGEVGGWKSDLDSDTVAAIEARYGSTMDRLGYRRVSAT